MNARTTRAVGILGLIGILALMQWRDDHRTTPKTQPPSGPPPQMSTMRYRSETPPNGKSGLVMLLEPGARVQVVVCLPNGCDQHQQTLKLLFRAYARSAGRMQLMGFFGAHDPADLERARSTSHWRDYDAFIINNREEFVVKDSDGESRKVKLRGSEDKDYQIADLEYVLRSEFTRMYPDYQLDLSDAPHVRAKVPSS